MSLTIRPATTADLPAILDIYNEAVLQTTASYEYDPVSLTSRQRWFEAHVEHNLPIFVAELELGEMAETGHITETRHIVGWSSLSAFHARIGYRFTVENSIYVSSHCRGQGIGRQLMAPLIQSAEQLGFHTIIAAVDAANEASLRLHKSFGFQPVGHLKEVGFKFDRWLDLIYLQRLL